MTSFAFGPGGVTLMSGTFIVAPRARLRSGRINSLVAENPRERAADIPAYLDRKSTRLNSSHSQISYAVFCLKKKKKKNKRIASTDVANPSHSPDGSELLG